MNWTDCPIIEQIPGKLSGAPVVRGTRLRPQDITGNAEMGVEWIVDAFGIAAEEVRTVLAFWAENWGELELEYIPPEQIAELGIDAIDWSGCPLVERTSERLSGAPVIRGTQVRAVDLLANRRDDDAELAWSYDLPVETVRSVLGYYDQRQQTRQLAPAV